MEEFERILIDMYRDLSARLAQAKKAPKSEYRRGVVDELEEVLQYLSDVAWREMGLDLEEEA